MRALFTPKQIRTIDQLAQQQMGDDGWVLMQRASKQAWSLAETLWPKAQKVYILVGPGHNGGDGYLLGQYAHQAGRQVTFCQTQPPQTGLALRAFQAVIQFNIKISSFNHAALQDADLVVDALFGIGLNRPLTPPWQDITQAVNLAGKPLLALDCPSGLNCETGQASPNCIKADHTAAFIADKLGYYQLDGLDYTGQIHRCNLGLEPHLIEKCPAEALCPDISDVRLPRRLHNSHKGDFGRALLIGGDQGMMGAIALAGLACLRSGTGLVNIISHEQHQTALTQMQPELMVNKGKDILKLISAASAVAIGPGLGQNQWSWQLFEQTCQIENPLIMDADALNLLAQKPRYNDHWILTPHPKEAARLLQISTTQIQQDRLAAVKELQRRFGGVIVLKGSGTLICDGQHLSLCRYGNGGMAKGGMGDVLTGLITGLVAQGIAPFKAAEIGCIQHAYTADRLADRLGQMQFLPSDLPGEWRLN